jgi:O-acetylserine/cysteine efflux transporter
VSSRDLAILLVIMAIWGLNFPIAKVTLAEFPPLLLMSLRFILVAALLVPFVRIPREHLRGVFIFSVLFGSIHFPLMFIGMSRVDAATASIAAQLQVPFSSLLAAFVFRDKLGWRRAGGMALAFAGVAVIGGEPRMADGLGGMLLIVAASAAFAVGNIHVKRMGEVDGFELNGWMALFAAPQLMTLSLLLEEGQWDAVVSASWIGWAGIVFMAVMVTLIAYGLWYPLLRRYQVNQTIPWTLTVPVFGVASSVALLGDPLTPGLVMGGLLTLTGIAVIVIRRPRSVVPAAGNPT